MTEDDGVIHFPADTTLPHVEIASADPDRFYLEKNLI